MWRYSYNLRGLYETPALAESDFKIDRPAAAQVIDAARRSGATLLDEFQSKQILSAYGIPVSRTLTAATSQAAVEVADAIGYPVVVKLFSRTLTHKTDVGGVKLNLLDRRAGRRCLRGNSPGRQPRPRANRISRASPCSR